MKKTVMLLLAACFIFVGIAFSAEKKGSSSATDVAGTVTDKTAIQDSMLQYIKAKTSPDGGAYIIEEVAAKFDYIHSGVNAKDGYYVSCVDFKSGADVYDIDYYVKEKGGKYEVVKEVLHKKNRKDINKVLYQKGEKKGSGMMEKKGSGKDEMGEKKGSGM